MELLQLGKKSRKLGLTINKNLHRDEYGMEDIEEFFADDTQAQIVLQEQEDRVLRQGEIYKSPTSYNTASGGGERGSGGVGAGRRVIPNISHYDLEQVAEDVPPYDSGFDLEDVNDDLLEQEDQSPFNYVARKIDFDYGAEESSGARGNKTSERDAHGVNQSIGTNKQSPLRSPLPEQRQSSAITGASQVNDFLEEEEDDYNYDYDYGQHDNNDGFYQNQDQYSDQLEAIGPASRQHNLRSRSQSLEPEPLRSGRGTEGVRSRRRTEQRRKRRNSLSESEESTQASVSAFNEDTKDTDEDNATEISDAVDSTATDLFVRSSSSTEPSQIQGGKQSTRSRVSRAKANVSPTTYITEVPSLPSPPPDGLRRSKRIRVKPLAFWRNERIIFTKPHQTRPDEDEEEEEDDDEPDMTIVRDIHKLPLRSIAEVVHVPDTAQILTRHNRRNTRRKPVDAPISPLSADEHDQEEQEILNAELPGTSWYKDKVLKIDVPENGQFVERSIAYSSQYGDFQSKSIVNEDGTTSEDPNLKIATLFNDDLQNCAVGVIELSGVKPPTKITFSTYYLLVVKGIVEFTFNEETFVANKGCNICIPSGNEYGLRNLGKEPALIHFVQVRRPETEQDEDDAGDAGRKSRDEDDSW
ncbi:MIF2 [Candida margitis]|uniref:MIF2 n=1 Tax=Candida margitis TaxID=1775924 RepID=UPI00222612EE|nr:MIF2 [Candida margitis]KAI5949835.1 MIF2 [Candida margitis]